MQFSRQNEFLMTEYNFNVFDLNLKAIHGRMQSIVYHLAQANIALQHDRCAPRSGQFWTFVLRAAAAECLPLGG